MMICGVKLTTIINVVIVLYIGIAIHGCVEQSNNTTDTSDVVTVESKHVMSQPNVIIKYQVLNIDQYSDKYDHLFNKYSKRFFNIGFDYRWFKAQGVAESNLVYDAKSPVGAQGVLQIMPKTYQEINNKFSEFNNVLNPSLNIGAGIYYDHTLFNQWTSERPFIDKMKFTLGSYNAGLGTILQAQKNCVDITSTSCNLWSQISDTAHTHTRWKSDETLHYVTKITTLMSSK